MRDVYHARLDVIDKQLVKLAGLVASALVDATSALLSADLAGAEAVISRDSDIDGLCADVDEQIMDLLARQQPVAGDLRMLVASHRINDDLERMGDLAAHVAKNARLRYPDHAVPRELRATIELMADTCADLAAKVVRILADRELEIARDLTREDDIVDRLHRDLFAGLANASEPFQAATAIDVVLIGRYYGRFADHAVRIADWLQYMATGYAEPMARVGASV